MDENRAVSFLRMIRRAQRGKLKIYLGYCAGVGKTYQMLMEAQRLKEDGIDIVAGYVETHGRKETGDLLAGLESIPRKSLTYHGIDIEEMDLQAILTRRPHVVLIDELAHTNVPGSKNSKRYQDVEEVLSAGIHVISTLNVQHLESLYETVERATGVKVRERIPDRVIAEADQIVNVDITTEDLQRRIKEGKVYLAENIETALAHFFKSSNLEQLRELTLRELAAQLDSRQRDVIADETTASPDQVVACLSSKGPNSEALLRYASRLAGRLNRNWYALYVQTSAESPTKIDSETQRFLSKMLILAQQLGATIFTYKGDDVAKTILQFAKEYRVGHIVVGSSGRKPSFWQKLKGESGITEKLLRERSGVTVVSLDTREIPGQQESAQVITPKPGAGKEKKKKRFDDEQKLWESLVSNAQTMIWNRVIDKEEAIEQLLSACCDTNPAVSYESARQGIFEREKQGSTFVGEDIAIPHARIENLGYPVLAVGVSSIAIHDPGSGNTARIMFLLLSPKHEPDLHVRILGTITRMACIDQWRENMFKVKNGPGIRRFLLE